MTGTSSIRVLMVALVMLFVTAAAHSHYTYDSGMGSSRMGACRAAKNNLIDKDRHHPRHQVIGDSRCRKTGPRNRPWVCLVDGEDDGRSSEREGIRKRSVHDLCEQVCWTDAEGNYQCETLCKGHSHRTGFGVRG